MAKATLQVGEKKYRMPEHIAHGLMTLLRGGPRFLYLVALSLFLGSFGLLALGFKIRSELRSETSASSGSMPTTVWTPVSTNSSGGDGK